MPAPAKAVGRLPEAPRRDLTRELESAIQPDPAASFSLPASVAGLPRESGSPDLGLPAPGPTAMQGQGPGAGGGTGGGIGTGSGTGTGSGRGPGSGSGLSEAPEAIHVEQPRYPEQARRARAEGTVWVRITIDSRGRVIEASAEEDSPPGGAPSARRALQEAAVSAARKWVFRPVLDGGRPVEARFRLPFRFSLGGP